MEVNLKGFVEQTNELEMVQKRVQTNCFYWSLTFLSTIYHLQSACADGLKSSQRYFTDREPLYPSLLSVMYYFQLL